MNHEQILDIILDNAAKKININISCDQQEKLMKYIDYILEWNSVYNITAIKTKEKILIYHIIDSLSVIPYLDKIYNHNIKLVDIGSGCGVPGVIFAIMNNRWNITCIDSVEKKTAFIKYVKRCLSLNNLQILNNRVELVDKLNCDIIISRAFSSLNNFILLSNKHLSENGTFVAMKGLIPDNEIKDFTLLKNWHITDIKDINVPYLKSRRCLIYIKAK